MSGSDSDEGLPPPIPVASRPSFNLKIGGLGLSTIAKEGKKTAEEIADMQTLAQSKLKPKKSSSSSEYSQSPIKEEQKEE